VPHFNRAVILSPDAEATIGSGEGPGLAHPTQRDKSKLLSRLTRRIRDLGYDVQIRTAA
jgi:hypothetical protein